MARKKKTQTVAVTSTNDIKYRGEVTVQKMRGGKVVGKQRFHNKGYSQLFIFLLNCLQGTFRVDDRPMYCFACRKDASNDSYSPLSTIPATVGTSDIQVNTTTATPNVTYRFYLPYNNNYVGEKLNALMLFSKTGYGKIREGLSTDASLSTDNCSMTVDFESGINVEQDTDLLIIWTLYVTNGGTTNE